MKVGFYISQIMYGGAEKVLVNLANGFDAKGFEVVLITTMRERCEPETNPSIKRYVINEEKDVFKSQSFLNNNFKLRKILKQEKIDVLISFMGGALIHGVLATRGLRTKSIISVRNDPQKIFGSSYRRVLAKTILPLSEACVFQTKEAMDWFPNKLVRKSVVIPNGINKSYFELAREPIQGAILTCGRLEKQKNQGLLIRAFARVSKIDDQATLWIIGEGSLQNRLENLTRELGIENKVKFLGVMKDISNYLSKADLFVLSSDFEGIPNVLIEAMASSVPSISTDCPCGGPAMLIDDQNNGVLVPVNDEIALSNAIVDLLSDETKKSMIGKEARKSVSKFDFDTILSEWIKLVLSVCKEKR